MNNHIDRCLALLSDMLTNRPKDVNGQTVLYNDEDREKYLDTIKAQRSEAELDKAIPSESRVLLGQLYGLMNEILIRRFI